MTSSNIAPIETYADDDGWHNRVAHARVALTHHGDSREEAEQLGAEMACQRGGGHIVSD
ncbi:hypothetical protein SAMN06295885_3588 [Rathayibacter oskolensis]|uniref:DUF2188 domain-containing protein n=1 Tax=Rathayibacter oskolensis TaxID=1891671 RepID=A0A1X7PGH0_9MICO|nr:hypothetical protein [Rathayibacter oskolensis]SMH50602.1 hypothetical protein SAMN06295885_3588 [Rathayibacter oskolensis]